MTPSSHFTRSCELLAPSYWHLFPPSSVDSHRLPLRALPPLAASRCSFGRSSLPRPLSWAPVRGASRVYAHRTCAAFRSDCGHAATGHQVGTWLSSRLAVLDPTPYRPYYCTLAAVAAVLSSSSSSSSLFSLYSVHAYRSSSSAAAAAPGAGVPPMFAMASRSTPAPALSPSPFG